MKRETIYTETAYDYDGYSIDEFIKKLKDFKKRYTPSYKDIKIEIVEEWGYYDDHWIEIRYTGIKKECKSKKSK